MSILSGARRGGGRVSAGRGGDSSIYCFFRKEGNGEELRQSWKGLRDGLN